MTSVAQGYRYEVTTEPTVEPVTLAEAKLHLRVDHTEEDALITSQIVAARRWAENWTRRKFVSQSLTLYLDCFEPMIRLPGGKTQSITSISYVDTDGATQTLATTYYTLDAISQPARLVNAYNQFYPAIRYVPNAVTIVYVAGFGATAATVPDEIKAAIKLMVAAMYEFREPEITGTTIAKVQFSVESLLGPHRVAEFF